MQGDLEPLLAQVRRAYQESMPLSIRGGGSKRLPVTGESVLDMRLYSGVVEYQPSELFITVRAGTLLVAVERLLEENGQMLAFEPPHLGLQATVGGMVAAGLSGPRRMTAGALRDYVLGVRLIDGQGRDLSFGGRVIKNVAGFDVSRLMVGAWGTLGVITEVTLKVAPRFSHQMTLEWNLSETQALKRMNEWIGQSWPITATSHHQGHFRVRLEGSAASVEVSAKALAGGREVHDGKWWWSALREQQLDFFATPRPLWRIVVRPTAPPLGLSGQSLIEWGGGVRWMVCEHGSNQVGLVAHHAGGYAQRHPSMGVYPMMLGTNHEGQRIHRALRELFDPRSILNPALLAPEWASR